MVLERGGLYAHHALAAVFLDERDRDEAAFRGGNHPTLGFHLGLVFLCSLLFTGCVVDGDDPFATNQAALDAVLAAFENEGTAGFI